MRGKGRWEVTEVERGVGVLTGRRRENLMTPEMRGEVEVMVDTGMGGIKTEVLI